MELFIGDRWVLAGFGRFGCIAKEGSYLVLMFVETKFMMDADEVLNWIMNYWIRN